MSTTEIMTLREHLCKAADYIAEKPATQWAGWVIYLLEILDGKDRQHIHRVWLEDIRDDISERLRHGRW